MSSRLYAYNPGTAIPGTSQSGNLAISNDSIGRGNVKWWNGPDEDLGYIIAYTDTSGNKTSNGVTVSGGAVGFRRSSKTDADFISNARSITGQTFSSSIDAVSWLNSNGYFTTYQVTQGLLDLFPGAIAAFSLRSLKASFNDLSPIRVRRTVGTFSTEVDVYFDTSLTVSLDSPVTQVIGSGTTSALNLGEFVAASGYNNPDALGSSQSAFVTVFRDQTGNAGNLVQTTPAFQPRIVLNGTLDKTPNGNVGLYFSYSVVATDAKWFTGGSIIATSSMSNGFTMFGVGRADQNTAGMSLMNASIYLLNNTSFYITQGGSSTTFGYSPNGYSFAASGNNNLQYTYYQVIKSNLVGEYSRTLTSASSPTSSFIAGTATVSFNANRVNLSSRYSLDAAANNPWRGWISEGIFYNSDQSANRSSIQQNQLNYYP